MKRTAFSIIPVCIILSLLFRCMLVEQSNGKEPRRSSGLSNPVPVKTGNKNTESRLKQDEVQTLIRLHDKARSDVGVGPLSWSAEVAAYAQKWADHLAASGCRMEHRPSSGKWRRIYGENLFMGTASYYGVGDAVDSWVSEKKYFHGRALNNSNWYAAGHYTQIVWRDTKTFGCAKSVCRDMVIVVCNYNPPGNMMGEKPY